MKPVHVLALAGIVVVVVIIAGYYAWTTLNKKDSVPDKPASQFDELVYQFVGKYTPLTDLQKREDWGKYRGLSIRGGGIVKEMSGSLVKLEHPKNRYEVGASISFRDSESERLSKLKIGESIGFAGRLDNYSDSDGLIVRDAALLSQS